MEDWDSFNSKAPVPHVLCLLKTSSREACLCWLVTYEPRAFCFVRMSPGMWTLPACSLFWSLATLKFPAGVGEVLGGGPSWKTQYELFHLEAFLSRVRINTKETRMNVREWIFCWRIPWTEEPDGLQSMGLGVAKSRTGLSDFIFTFTSWF